MQCTGTGVSLFFSYVCLFGSFLMFFFFLCFSYVKTRNSQFKKKLPHRCTKDTDDVLLCTTWPVLGMFGLSLLLHH